jgi:hypothetical protein
MVTASTVLSKVVTKGPLGDASTVLGKLKLLKVSLNGENHYNMALKT